MDGKKALRVALDVALTVMIVFEMLIQFTGEFLHEVVGFAFFATVMVHLALSATWMKKTARTARAGKLTARRTVLATIGCLLALTTIVLGVSSIAISGILSSAGFVWPIGNYAMWVTVHTFSSYALCALVVVHLATHWIFLAHAFKIPYSPSRRRAIGTGVNAVAALGVLALGVTVATKMGPQSASANASTTQDATTPSSGGNTDSPTNANDSSSGTTGTPHSGKSANSHGRGSNVSGSNSGSGANRSGSTGSGSSSGESKSGSASGSSDEVNPGTTNGSPNASGICTLCRKQCPLSAPKCSKPYEEGLL